MSIKNDYKNKQIIGSSTIKKVRKNQNKTERVT